MRADPAEEAVDVGDFAAVGIEFRAPDGSGIDFGRVPGLQQTGMDAHGAWLAGPLGGSARTLPDLRLCFHLPAPACQVVVTIRSWRNSHVVHVADPILRQMPVDMPGSGAEAGTTPPLGRNRIVLGREPTWFHYGLVPGRPITLRGQLVRTEASDGAFVAIAYRDRAGALIAPPYPDVMATPSLPAFVGIPVHGDAYRFTVALVPPPGAVTLDAGFAAWDDSAILAMPSAPEVSLGHDLRLEALANAAGTSVESVLAHALSRLAPADGTTQGPPSTAPLRLDLDHVASAEPHAPLRSCDVARAGPDATGWTAEHLRLAHWPAWPLPEHPDWRADPFSAPAWRIAFQSLSWLHPATAGEDRAMRRRAVELCLAWSRANPWGQPADPLSLHPACLARRAEALLGVLAGVLAAADEADATGLGILGGEVVQHGLALAEILGQNTLAGNLLELQAAASLLGIARALPTFPLAAHWEALAMAALRRGFDARLGPDAPLAEPSYHQSLELLTLALAMVPILRARPASIALADHLEDRLAPAWQGFVGCLEPDGTLPPFGDAPARVDCKGWIARLTAAYGRPWMAFPPRGATNHAPADPVVQGVLARRRGGPTGWASFTSDFSPRHDPQDHRDCTSFTFGTGAVRWITEAGGSQSQQPRRLGRYLASGRAHNVVLPDGREPTAGAGVPRTTARIGDASIHIIDTTVHGPDYRHARAFVLLDDLSGIAVLDAFATADRPLFLEGFLHVPPEVVVALTDPQRAFGLRDGRRLSIVGRMLVGRFGGLSVTSGWNGPSPAVQGFVAGPTEAMQPAAVLSYGMSGQRRVCGGVLIAASRRSLDALVRTVDDVRFAPLIVG
ncbi:heparinase II/III family protein [Methylobacterium sp. E-016]|nr:heparinase II/III family protein [Methylobacterium sp. E-016]MCJ2076013.1 heparinase II/III family protein [Methylobacterium sp. E-016]